MSLLEKSRYAAFGFFTLQTRDRIFSWWGKDFYDPRKTLAVLTLPTAQMAHAKFNKNNLEPRQSQSESRYWLHQKKNYIYLY